MPSTPKWYEKSYKSDLKGKNRRVLGPVEDKMREELLKRNAKRDKEHLHPSEMSKNDWCIRATWYKINDVTESDPENLDLRRINILAEGNSIHDKWQGWLRQAGLLAGMWRCTVCHESWWADSPPTEPCECGALPYLIGYAEVPVKDEKHRIIGHADGLIIDDKGKALLEIKSVGLGTIRWDAPQLYELYEDGTLGLEALWKRLKRPLTTHLRQINLYMHCTGIHDAVVLYEWKPSQEVKEFHVKYDANLVAPILELADTLIDHLDDGTIPLPLPGAQKSKQPCVFCNYKKECFGG